MYLSPDSALIYSTKVLEKLARVRSLHENRLEQLRIMGSGVFFRLSFANDGQYLSPIAVRTSPSALPTWPLAAAESLTSGTVSMSQTMRLFVIVSIAVENRRPGHSGFGAPFVADGIKPAPRWRAGSSNYCIPDVAAVPLCPFYRRHRHSGHLEVHRAEEVPVGEI
jgi:hypothetical protein